MAKPTLLITGGSGFLGARLTRLALQSEAWAAHSTYFANPTGDPDSHRLDLRDQAATSELLSRLRPSVIIHQAVSPRSPADVAAIVPAARHLLDGVAACGARLIHVSTDMVFNGANPPYDEDAPLTPANTYGAAKAAAEVMVGERLPLHSLIVRPSLIYGFDPIDKQTGWLVDGVRNHQPISLFTNEIRCPIWVDTLALALLELAASTFVGRLNLGGLPINRWDLGRKMLECLGIQPGATVHPALSTPELGRPTNLTLDCRKAHHLLHTPILSIDEAFQEHRRRRQS